MPTRTTLSVSRTFPGRVFCKCFFSREREKRWRSVFFLQVFRERGFTGTAATAGAGNFRIANFVNFFSHPKSKVEQCAEHEYGGKNNVEHGEKGEGCMV